MSGRPDSWMPMYWGDYIRDTGHLNNAGHGAYLMLMKHYWCTGEALVDDDDELWRIACCDSKKDWIKLRPKIARMFTADAGLLRHKRIDRELAKAASVTDAKAEAGRKGAERRWQKNGSAIALPLAEPLAPDGTGIAEPSVRHRQSDAQPQPQPQPHLPKPALSETPNPSARDANGRLVRPPSLVAEKNPAKTNGSVPFEGAQIEARTGKITVNGWYWDVVLDRVYEAAAIDDTRWTGTYTALIRWMQDGIDPDIIVAAVQQVASRPQYRVPASLQYFDRAVREQHGRKAA